MMDLHSGKIKLNETPNPFWNTVILSPKMFSISLAWWLPPGKRRALALVTYCCLMTYPTQSGWKQYSLTILHSCCGSGIQGTAGDGLSLLHKIWGLGCITRRPELRSPSRCSFLHLSGSCLRMSAGESLQHGSCVPRANDPERESGRSHTASKSPSVASTSSRRSRQWWSLAFFQGEEIQIIPFLGSVSVSCCEETKAG